LGYPPVACATNRHESMAGPYDGGALVAAGAASAAQHQAWNSQSHYIAIFAQFGSAMCTAVAPQHAGAGCCGFALQPAQPQHLGCCAGDSRLLGLPGTPLPVQCRGLVPMMVPWCIPMMQHTDSGTGPSCGLGLPVVATRDGRGYDGQNNAQHPLAHCVPGRDGGHVGQSGGVRRLQGLPLKQLPEPEEQGLEGCGFACLALALPTDLSGGGLPRTSPAPAAQREGPCWGCVADESDSGAAGDVGAAAERVDEQALWKDAHSPEGAAKLKAFLKAAPMLDVPSLSMTKEGSEKLQALLESPEFGSEWKSMVAAGLRGRVHEAWSDDGGGRKTETGAKWANYVVQKCIEQLTVDDTGFIVEELLSHDVVEMSCHIYGCRIVQRVIEHIPVSSLAATRALVEELIREDAVHKLMRDKFGNYVLQRVLEKGSEEHKRTVVGFLMKIDVQGMSLLIKHDVASHVMQTALQQCPDSLLKSELLSKMDEVDPGVWKTKFGSFVKNEKKKDRKRHAGCSSTQQEAHVPASAKAADHGPGSERDFSPGAAALWKSVAPSVGAQAAGGFSVATSEPAAAAEGGRRRRRRRGAARKGEPREEAARTQVQLQ